MHAARSAIERLKAGNRRYVSDDLQHCNLFAMHVRRSELVSQQQPFATILGCSDSRVPAEIIFDQGLGDLFVVRVAGNVVGPSQIGSVEYAAEHLGTRLVVVLGHTSCGAVIATLDELQREAECRSPGLCSIVDQIRPSVKKLLQSELRRRPDELLRQAVRANIHASVEKLKRGSAIIEGLIQANQLLIVGAEYAMESGKVEFMDLFSQDF